MPFIDEVQKYKSLSIVGLEKNTGKTECLNYILKRLPEHGLQYAVTSVGVDGERTDRLTNTAKPEIFLKKGVIFTTSEKYYRNRRILSELLDIGDKRTALGRLITARVLMGGKILLSGPSSTSQLVKWMDMLQDNFEVDLCIIDGALSRLSHASPIVSQAMILTTGASLSIDYETLVRQTLFTIELINIPVTKLSSAKLLEKKEQSSWIVTEKGDIIEIPDFTAFSAHLPALTGIENPVALYLSGALTDRFLNKITDSKEFKNIELIVADFTKIFVEILAFKRFINNGGQISVLCKSKLLAVCVNPVAPNGVVLNSERICNQISVESGFPVYDIFKNGYKI